MGQMLQGLGAHGPDMQLGRDTYHLQGVRLGEAVSIDELEQHVDVVAAPPPFMFVVFASS